MPLKPLTTCRGTKPGRSRLPVLGHYSVQTGLTMSSIALQPLRNRVLALARGCQLPWLPMRTPAILDPRPLQSPGKPATFLP